MGFARAPPPPLLQRKANNLHGLFVLTIAPTLYRRGRHKSAVLENSQDKIDAFLAAANAPKKNSRGRKRKRGDD